MSNLDKMKKRILLRTLNKNQLINRPGSDKMKGKATTNVTKL